MKVEDIMIKDVKYISPNDTISKALGIMKNNKIHQLVVMDENKFMGMLEIKKIVTKDLNPKTKIHTLITNVPTINKDENIEKCIELLLNSGLRALPVVEKNKIIGIISETDILKVADKFFDTNKNISEIATKCLFVNKYDNVGKIKKIMRENNISRVPVIEKDKIIGVVDTLDLIKLYEGMERMDARGGKLKEAGTKEKLRINITPAEAIMSEPIVVSSDKKLKDIISMLQKYEEIIVQNGSICIVTPKDILELFVSQPKRGIYVQITGMQNENIEFKVKMDQQVNEFIQKFGKLIENIEYLFIHIEKMQKGGKKIKYSIRVRFKTPFGLFVSHAWGWQPINIIQIAFNKLEREVLKKYEKLKNQQLQRRSKMKRRF
ncbi:MAG: CBS domain-containing protein [Candidatus Aenigmatarchaeota archaeon]